MTRADRLREGEAEDRIAVLQEIASSPAMTPEERALVIACLGDDRKSVQRRAAEVLARRARLDPGVFDRLNEVVRAAPWRQRWGATFALSLIGQVPPSALPTLLEALGNDDGDVRWAAADLVKTLAPDDPSVVAALVERAGKGTPNERKMALYVLRDLKAPEGIGVALAGLQDGGIEVRLAALATLVGVGGDRARAAERVVPLVHDHDARMRRAAAAALGQLEIATDVVRSTLEQAAKADDPALRRAADRALRRILPAIS